MKNKYIIHLNDQITFKIFQLLLKYDVKHDIISTFNINNVLRRFTMHAIHTYFDN